MNDKQRAKRIAAIQAKREALGQSHSFNRLTAAINRAIESGCPVYVNQPESPAGQSANN